MLLTLLGLTLRHFSDGDYTFVVTAGAGVQCLGFWLLLTKVRGCVCGAVSMRCEVTDVTVSMLFARFGCVRVVWFGERRAWARR